MAEAACAGPAAYRPRRARDSLLYRLAETHHETFKQVYDERFAQRYGFWRTEVERTLWAFLDCGIEEHGCAWQTVRDLYRAGLQDRHAVPGMVVSIQTYGDLANWQPHLHTLVSAGVFNRQGEFTALGLPPAGVAEELLLRRDDAGHRLHRRPGGDPEDPAAPAPHRTARPRSTTRLRSTPDAVSGEYAGARGRRGVSAAERDAWGGDPGRGHPGPRRWEPPPVELSPERPADTRRGTGQPPGPRAPLRCAGSVIGFPIL